MNLQERISAFAALGTAITNLRTSELEHIYANALNYNTWFTAENVQIALDGIKRYLQKDKLELWVANYALEQASQTPKVVGLVLAGNIPLVGFHDFLAVLVAGHKAKVKLSHQDPFLLPYLANILIEIAPEMKSKIDFADRLTGVDAIIATGSDNSSRYFDYYFSKYPHIIRKNRTSIAIITGKESKEELYGLGKDVFQYFGLGCRNVSKLLVPKNYDFASFFEAIQSYESIRENHRYVNNYDYNKSIYLVNKVPHLDNGFLLLTASSNLVSPISVLYYDTYDAVENIPSQLASVGNKLQCILATNGWYANSLPLGKAQEPELWDYADDVDTLQFLKGL